MQNQISPQIIELAVRGDENAFRTLVDTHQRFVYSLACKMLCDREDALDVTQETFIRIWKHLPKYRAEVKFTTWLYKIVSNLCLDAIRAQNIRRGEKRIDRGSTFITDMRSADDDLHQNELIETIRKLSTTLTPKQQVIFVLRDLEGLEVDEVCETLSVSKGNVKSNLYYARQKMAGLLNSYYQDKKKIT
jgi:RNA polymerase sigma-70 factor, ECF subfamily